MKLNDFNIGDIAYQLSIEPHEKEIREVKVSKIGRKYITTKAGAYGWERQFYLCKGKYGIEFLEENIDFGYKKLLFKSKEDANAYLEALSLTKWIRRSIDCINFLDFNLDRLRKIKEIIEGGESI